MPWLVSAGRMMHMSDPVSRNLQRVRGLGRELKARLARGERVVGAFIKIPSPDGS
jgi:hypothetical protein